MKRILILFALLIMTVVGMAQAPSNYTNINGRYRWIAGMFDSTFSIPKGATPSLRTGGSTNPGAIFYRTSDSSLYIYTGTQWLKQAGTSGFVPYVGATQDVDLDTWSAYAKSFHVKGTGGQGHLGLKFQSGIPNMSANESGVYADANGNLGIKIDNAHTSIFKTSLNTADRTYTLENKSYTIGDSADIAARVKYTDTASMLSPYLRKVDTASLSNRINLKVNISDTASMLSPYAQTNAVNAGLALKVNISDTSSMLSPYLRKADTTSLSNRINLKVNISDTSSMLGNYLNNVGYGLARTGQVVRADSATLSNYYLRRKDSLTATNLLGYVTKQVLADTASAIRGADAGGTVKSVATNTATGITGGTITTSGTLAIDTLLISTRAWRQKGVDSLQANINGKVNISDTATMLSPYLRSNVASATYVPQTRTITINGTSQDLSANRTYNVGTVTSVATSTGTGITGGTITSSGTIAADTTLLSTRLWRQKGVDSVAALANTKVSSVSGTAPIVSSGGTTPAISIPKATASVDGYLAYTDYNFFADKIGGSGTNTYIPKFTSTNAIQNSVIREDASGNIGVGGTPNAYSNITTVTANGTNGAGFEMNQGGTLVASVNASSTSFNVLANSTATTQMQIGTTGHPIKFLTMGSEKMRLDSLGKLALGGNYSSINSTLQVTGNAAIGYTSAAPTNGLAVAGNVSIGNTNNTYKLDVTGTGRFTSELNVAPYLLINNSQSYFGDNGSIENGTADGNTRLQYYTGKYLTFKQSGTERMLLDASGNLGLGVSPSTWTSIDKVFEIGRAGNNLFSGGLNDISISANAYFNSGWKYGATGAANLFSVGYGLNSFVWLTAPSGTAGNAISFTQAMTLFSTGNLAVGGTSDAGYKLDVNGAANIGTNLFVQSDALFYARLRLQTNSSYYQAGTIGYNSTDGNYIWAKAGSNNNFTILNDGGSSVFTLASTGAATFSSSVTATAFIPSSSTIPTNGLYLPATNSLGWATNSGNKMTLDASGNLGLGVTPSTWQFGKAFELNYVGNGLWNNGVNDLTLVSNVYYNAGFKYGSNGYATKFSTYNGAFEWYTAPSGTAGNAITFTQAMTLNANSELLINTTSDAGDYKLQVTGNIYGSGNLTAANVIGTTSVSVKSGNGLILYNTGNTNYFQIYTDASNILNFGYGGTYPKATLSSGGNLELIGSIKTAAPTSGTAKTWLLGEAATVSPTSPNRTIRVEIDGVVYYIAAKTTND